MVAFSQLTLSAVALLSAASAGIIPDILDDSQQIFVPTENSHANRPASSELPPIDTDKLQDLIAPEALNEWAHKLWHAANTSTEVVGNPTRAIGTPGFNATVGLIVDTLEELSDYYSYQLQPFVVPRSIIHNYSVSLPDKKKTLDSRAFKLSPGADVTAPLAFALNKGCLPSDYPDVSGKIVVAQSGDCAFGMKSELAGQAQAQALLIYDPTIKNPREPKLGTLGTPTPQQIATLGISFKQFKQLVEGELARVQVDSEIDLVETVNVIAETREGDHDNVVFSGAHSDSVTVGPGINDNGSGLLAQLEVAKQLVNFKVNNAVRFAWWAAEENGLKGSLHYTENLTKREAAKIRLFLDYDMLGSRNYIYEIYDSDDSENPKGSSALRDMYIAWYEKHGYNYTLQEFDGRSDYVGFVEIGIPSSGIDAGVEEIKTDKNVEQFGGESGVAFDECYHLACDDLSNVDLEPWVVNAKLVGHSVSTYATSLEGFPENDLSYFKQRGSSHQGPKKWRTVNSYKDHM